MPLTPVFAVRGQFADRSGMIEFMESGATHPDVSARVPRLRDSVGILGASLAQGLSAGFGVALAMAIISIAVAQDLNYADVIVFGALYYGGFIGVSAGACVGFGLILARQTRSRRFQLVQCARLFGFP